VHYRDQPAIAVPGHDPVQQALTNGDGRTIRLCGAGHCPANVDGRDGGGEETNFDIVRGLVSAFESGSKHGGVEIFDRLSSVGRIATHVGKIGVLGKGLCEGVGVVLVPGIHEIDDQSADRLLVSD